MQRTKWELCRKNRIFDDGFQDFQVLGIRKGVQEVDKDILKLLGVADAEVGIVDVEIAVLIDSAAEDRAEIVGVEKKEIVLRYRKLAENRFKEKCSFLRSGDAEPELPDLMEREDASDLLPPFHALHRMHVWRQLAKQMRKCLSDLFLVHFLPL